MLNFFKKPKISPALLVAASLAALVLLPLFLVILKNTLASDNPPAARHYPAKAVKEKTGDPLITKTPAFKAAMEKLKADTK